MQVRAAVFVLLVCTLASRVASVSVVRIPRVYNVLIRSDGALQSSEAVSADSVQLNNNDEAAEDAADPAVEDDEGQEGEEPKTPRRQELPVLDAKMGAIQEGVNYTEVPLSRAYPLTRYTAPLLAPLSYITPLHGGLILGPVPRLSHIPQTYPQPQQQQQGLPQTYPEPQQQQQQAPRGLSLPRGAFEEPERDSIAVEAAEEQEDRP